MFTAITSNSREIEEFFAVKQVELPTQPPIELTRGRDRTHSRPTRMLRGTGPGRRGASFFGPHGPHSRAPESATLALTFRLAAPLRTTFFLGGRFWAGVRDLYPHRVSRDGATARRTDTNADADRSSAVLDRPTASALVMRGKHSSLTSLWRRHNKLGPVKEYDREMHYQSQNGRCGEKQCQRPGGV